MDRIESMTHAELKVATRELVGVARHAFDACYSRGVTYNNLREALAAFDPSPADIAAKALEDAGFVRISNIDGNFEALVFNPSGPNHFYKLKEKA